MKEPNQYVMQIKYCSGTFHSTEIDSILWNSIENGVHLEDISSILNIVCNIKNESEKRKRVSDYERNNSTVWYIAKCHK